MIRFLNSLYLMLSHPQSPWVWTNSLYYLLNLLHYHTTRSRKGALFALGTEQAGTYVRVGAAPRAQRGVFRAWPEPEGSPTLGQPIWSIRAKKWEDRLDDEEEPEKCRQCPHWEVTPPVRSIWTTTARRGGIHTGTAWDSYQMWAG